MRIGVTSIFSFRPHVEHLAYVARLLGDSGHEIHSLTCDATLSHCYGRLLRQRSKLRECPRCMLGGVRSYPLQRVSSMDGSLRKPLDPARLWRLVISSVAVRYRTEAPDYLESPQVRAALAELAAPVETAYANTLRWIERNRLDAVVLFNGRMDVLSGVVAACEDLQIPYISLERPWLGHGISMFANGNCLDLRAFDKMCLEFRDRPLLPAQARYAGAIGAQHFMGRNRLLWRVYNAEASRTSWPHKTSGPRVLILPGSRNESEGHPHWQCAWGEYTTAFDHLLDHTRIRGEDCVLRCHPNWGEKIGSFTGWRSEQYYTEWGERRGVHVVPSSSRDSTYDLIAAADVVVVNGSSTGVEAALRGKRVILVGHATYQRAGFCASLGTPAELQSFSLQTEQSPQEISQRALRFMYLTASRFPQFVRFVRATSNTRCEYYEGADASRVIEMLRTGEVTADDDSVAATDVDERQIAQLLLAGDWEALSAPADGPAHAPTSALEVQRRFGLRWVDNVRDKLPRGDA